MKERDRQLLLEVGLYRAKLDQLLADIPADFPAQKIGERYATALWEYMLTWRERLPEDQWNYLLAWMVDEFRDELENAGP